MKVRLRYVTRRKNKNGSYRYYWVRRGQPVIRLPDNEAQRITRATELNEDADNEGLAHHLAKGTIAWAIDEYRNSADFTGRAASTRRAYGRWMQRLSDKHGDMRLRQLTRGNVKAIIASVRTDGGRRHLAAVLARIVEVARDHEYLTHNTADKLRIPAPGKRDRIWTEEDEQAFLKTCEGNAYQETLRLGLLLLLYTGQRPCDMLKMTWKDYDGQSLKVVQQKTGTRVDVACAKALKPLLDAARKRAKGLTIIGKLDGTRFAEGYWRERFREVRDKAGLGDLQGRDCRRTAVMRLYEVEATEAEIASITGHSIAAVKNILNAHYFVRTAKLAKAGITKLERKRDREV